MKWYSFGEVRQSEAITTKEINEVMTEARKHIEAIRNVPTVYILDILERVGRIFSDTKSDFYNDVVNKMNLQLGWSKEMVKEGLATISEILTQDNLTSRLEADLGDINYLDEFTYNPSFKGMVT